jgi:hypothetical protein
VGLLDFFLATREGVEWTIGATKSSVETSKHHIGYYNDRNSSKPPPLHNQT